MMQLYVLDLSDVDRRDLARVGGKAANLGELMRIEGVDVPPGFCVTTAAYARFLEATPGSPVPDDVAAAIRAALARFDADTPFAVRSSATAEDLPDASFAGQQDSFLDVVGADAVIDHVRRVWASLFTERAVAYRRHNGIADAQMAVVVQRMVASTFSGVLFTADPVNGDRKVTTIEAVPGLGDALVAGLVTPDVYRVREGRVIGRALAPQHDGATLTDAQVEALAALGRRIEAHFGCPQDIEWCLAGDIKVVQSRPITTLFPIPPANDGTSHVYISVGHQQMMTDALKPLGASMWQLTVSAPMHEAGGRLFVDVTRILASPATRAGFLQLIGRSEPLIADALQAVVARPGFLPPLPEGAVVPPPPGTVPASIETDPAIVAALIAANEASLATLEREIATKQGAELIAFIRADVPELKRTVFSPQSLQVIVAGMDAAWWLDEQLGKGNGLDVLTQSVPHNITSEMGLALMDVADVIRPHADVVAFLQEVDDDGFLDVLPTLPGGDAARAAIQTWLDRYGVRGVGEIDITRPRWRERPTLILPMLLANVRIFEAGAAARRFAEGLRAAEAKAAEILARLRGLPDGEEKAEETRRKIERVRTFAGYREYPKYALVSRTFLYKQALMREAARLVAAGVLREVDDLHFLRLEEIEEVLGTERVDRALIGARRAEFRRWERLTPPRVLTSDGEGITGEYRRDDVPAGALVGLAVSAGTVEGRARVVLDLADADFAEGDILVTRFTDPSWTPVFLAIRGLVTEVGGMMTHGAVIAREYGLPAVVSVVDATRRIRDGQRIRVHGAAGFVEVVDG